MPENNDQKTITHNTSPYPSGFRLLSDAQLQEIHLASLEIIRLTGVRVHEEQALEIRTLVR
jgi:trimethylamine:corrinoid methyltransferase-like protein